MSPNCYLSRALWCRRLSGLLINNMPVCSGQWMGRVWKKVDRVQRYWKLGCCWMFVLLILLREVLDYRDMYRRLLVLSFIYLFTLVCLKTGPLPLPKWILHEVWRSVLPFNFQYPFFSWRSFSSWLLLLPRLSANSILPSICLSIRCFRKSLLRSM